MNKSDKIQKFILTSVLIISLVSFNFPGMQVLAEEDEETIIETGDAVVAADVDNEVNTNIVNTEENIATTTEEELLPEMSDDAVASSTPVVLESSDVATTTEVAASTTPAIDVDVENNNEAVVENIVEVSAGTGGNNASGNQNSIIDTGNAIAQANVLNIVNTNIIDSSGLFVLLNKFFGFSGNIDLRGTDFANSSSSDSCDPCLDTSVKNENSAVITNSIIVRSSTGENNANNNEGDALIDTGHAYAAANVMNIANTNIINSNYLLLAFNNFGSLVGDLVFPGKDFFSKFFSQGGANNSNKVKVENDNEAVVENNINTNAGTGNNEANNNGTSAIQTGNAFSSANVINQVNTNIFNDNSFLVLVRVHGNWSGNIFGMPQGIFWRENGGGIELFSSGSDSTTPSMAIDNQNSAEISNDIQVLALTGENKVDSNGGDAIINTGSAYAGANVLNVANTNVIGGNWLLAMINIFGDWEGNIAFGRPDLWVGGRAEAHGASVGPGSGVSYHFTIVNRGDADATGVRLSSLFDSDYMAFLDFNNEWDIGNIPAGNSVEVTYEAKVKDNIPVGHTTINNTVTVASMETDEDTKDNIDVITLLAYKENPAPPTPLGLQIPYTPTPVLKITKTNNAEGPLTASSTVDYKIVLTNDGGSSYHSVLTDVIKDKNGDVIHKESWDLDEIFPNEEITITYTVVFNASTTPGTYTNYAQVNAIGRYPTLDYGWFADSNIATSLIEIMGPEPEVVLSEGTEEIKGGGISLSEARDALNEIENNVQKIKEAISRLMPGKLFASASDSIPLVSASTPEPEENKIIPPIISPEKSQDKRINILKDWPSRLGAALRLSDINPYYLAVIIFILLLGISIIAIKRKGSKI